LAAAVAVAAELTRRPGRTGGKEARAAGGGQDRIDHDRQGRLLGQRRRHRLDGAVAGEQASLGCGHLEALERRFDLGADERVGDGGPSADPYRVLGGDSGDGGEGVAPERPDGALVRLDARTAAAIGAGDREHAEGGRHGAQAEMPPRRLSTF
jgi:hypothetical protein